MPGVTERFYFVTVKASGDKRAWLLAGENDTTNRRVYALRFTKAQALDQVEGLTRLNPSVTFKIKLIPLH